MHPTNRQDCEIDLTSAASTQISLIKDNDFTLGDAIFRIKIGGKGCDGFTYELGFSTPHEDDEVLTFENTSVHMDPFTYYYCKEGHIDFLFNPKTNEDGFIFINKNEGNYHGKFFKDDELAPKGIKENNQ